MAKKTFKENPALRFITSTDDANNKQNTDNTENDNITYDKHYTDNKHERKSKRLNLLIQPSILENLSKIAHMKQTSVNDLVNSVLKNYAETEEETISVYDKVFIKK
jgi:predicted HicB family RNase H-like nuclease